MKSYGGVWRRLTSLDTMLKAFHLAAMGKRSVPEVRDFQSNLHENLTGMIHDLESGSYRFGPYRRFMVWDPKPRQIHVAPFSQRVMHHAIILVVGSFLERSLVFDSYACRKGKGQHAAALRAYEFAKKSPWYLKMDIEKFYDSINHDCLRALLNKRFREKEIHKTFDALIGSYETSSGCGLPIGNLTSQYFGNMYLDAFDHWVSEFKQVRGYVRYMDDMLIFCNTRDELNCLRHEIASWFDTERGLKIKHDGELNQVSQGIPFVGFIISPQSIRLHKRSAQRYSRKLGSLKRSYRMGLSDEQELQERSVSLVAATKLAKAEGFRKSVEERQHTIKGYA